MSDNIIMFPKGRLDAPPQTREELFAHINGVKMGYVTFLVEDAMSYVFQRLSEEGYDVDEQDYFKTVIAILDSIVQKINPDAVEVRIHDPLLDNAEQDLLDQDEVKEE